MHYLILDRWSRQNSLLHRVDARFKILGLLAFLIGLATARPDPRILACYSILIAAGIAVSGLPRTQVLARGCVVLPFVATIGIIRWITEGGFVAGAMVAKGYLSGLAVLLVVATTRMTDLVQGAARLGLSRTIVLVIQFLHRYLLLITDEASRMLAAAQLRGISLSKASFTNRLKAASGAVAALFGRSYNKAESVHSSMVVRGFSGSFPQNAPRPAESRDAAFLVLLITALLSIRAWF